MITKTNVWSNIIFIFISLLLSKKKIYQVFLHIQIYLWLIDYRRLQRLKDDFIVITITIIIKKNIWNAIMKLEIFFSRIYSINKWEERKSKNFCRCSTIKNVVRLQMNGTHTNTKWNKRSLIIQSFISIWARQQQQQQHWMHLFLASGYINP